MERNDAADANEPMNDDDAASRLNRRRFLGLIGVGAGASAVALAGPVGSVIAAPPAARSETAVTSPTSFGRIFPQLPPFAEANDAVRAALVEMGKPGGLLDARDNLAAGPIALITDPLLSANNPNNPTHTAGTTFFGQFVDHDITFDTASPLGVPTEPSASVNSRTPSLDLDSVYGAGPVASAQLYDPADRAKLLVGAGPLFEDLPRSEGGGAVIGDPRNDEHMVIAGLQAAFLLFHNRMVDQVRAEDRDTRINHVHREARRLTTWHYQWMIVHEFLPLIVGQPMVDDILRRGRRAYRAGLRQAFMPVEFQGACYRFGHSMVRPSYRANLKGDNGAPFFGMIFDPAGDGQADPSDLRGGSRAARRFIGWQTFFDFGDGEVKPNKLIDTKLSTPLFNLPLGAIASHSGPQALPERTLLRHLTWSLPSGQAIASRLGVAPLAAGDLDELRQFGVGFETSTPLWYYTLKEAEVVEHGLRLGPVGGRIVAEVLLGLLFTDPDAYVVARPSWQPTAGASSGTFRMTDFLRFAGVDPATRHAHQPSFA